MGPSEEFFPFVAGNLAEEVVSEGDDAGEVGSGNDGRGVDRFAVFLAEVFGGYGMRVQKRYEAFFEHPVEYVRFG